MTLSTPRSVIVIGPGPAGLTAAYRLTLQGHRVTVVSQSSALGEHLRREGDPPLAILGCHHATWSLLRSLGVTPMPTTFHNASLEFLLPNGRLARYPTSQLPAPLHQLITIGQFAALSWGERWKLLSWLEQLWEGALQLAADLEHRTAQDWFESLGHSQSTIQTVWHPLAQWLTGNDLRNLSADAFVAAAKPIFLSRGADNRICVPRQPWHHMFVQPVADRLQQAGATLLLDTRAMQFQFEHERITGVRVQDGRILQADWYIAAVAHHQLTPLLPERWLTRYAYFQQIAELTTTPFTVIQVRTAQTVHASRHIMMGTGPFPWMVCKPSEADKSLVAVLTIPPDQSTIDTQEQVSALLRSLALLQPDSQLTSFRQHEVAHAVLGLQPGTKARRPIQLSPIPNLLLAGAWTDTGWPAILESAIISGERCAEIINGRKPV